MGIFGKPPESKPAELPRPAEKQAPGAPARSGPCVIGSRTVVKGEITGEEDVVVEGSVEGQIRIAKDLYVAQAGSVKATVAASCILVSGELLGDCHASTRVEIQATGRLTGNIRAPKVVIAEGAVFKGNSDMSGRREERKEHPAGS